jgi:hypothetical protein
MILQEFLSITFQKGMRTNFGQHDFEVVGINFYDRNLTLIADDTADGTFIEYYHDCSVPALPTNSDHSVDSNKKMSAEEMINKYCMPDTLTATQLTCIEETMEAFAAHEVASALADSVPKDRIRKEIKKLGSKRPHNVKELKTLEKLLED